MSLIEEQFRFSFDSKEDEHEIKSPSNSKFDKVEGKMSMFCCDEKKFLLTASLGEQEF